MSKKMSNEEIANVATALPGAVAAIALAPILIVFAARHDWVCVVSTVLFVAGMLFMQTSSTLYHWVWNPKHKARLRVMDHSAIYVMIAGCYSLICTSVIGGWMGITLFFFLWACVIAGTIGKIVALGKYPRLSLALYLAMGWVALVVIYPVYVALPTPAFWCIVGEGAAYSIGSFFFANDEKYPYFHAIWHVFILLGSACHTVATFFILLW